MRHLETPIASNLESVVEFVLDMREQLRPSIKHAQHAEEQKNKSKFGMTKKLVVDLSSGSSNSCFVTFTW